MNKYGPENFKIDLVEERSIEFLEDREKHYIDLYNTYNVGYNATIGGDGSLQFDYSAIVEEYKKGGSLISVSKIFGCSTDTVHNALKEYNIPTRNKREF